MSKKTITAKELGVKLGNNKMSKLVARIFGKDSMSISDEGNMELSEDEERRIAALYGDAFLSKLKSLNFNEQVEENSTELFDEAVRFKAEELVKDKDRVIAQLRSDIEELVKEPESDPKANAATTIIRGSYAVNLAAAHYKSIAKALASENPMDFRQLEGSSIDVADLNQEFKGSMPPRVRLDIFNRNIYLGLPDSPLFTREQSNTDYKATASLFTEVSQAFTPVWTPKGSAKFTPVTIPYRRHKINVSFKPADIIKSWLTYLYEQGKTPSQQPVTRYIIENMIMPKVQDDITRVMLGKGKYVEPSADAAEGSAGTSAISSMDGIETILVEDKKASAKKFNHYKNAKDPFTLKGQELIDYVASFVKAISKYFVNSPLIYCSEQFLQHYQAQDYAVNGKYTGTSIGRNIRFTTFEFQPMKCMYGSPILFCTPKTNMVMLVDYATAANCINKVEEHHYNVDILGEYSLSVGFRIAEAVYASVPADYNPSDGTIGNSPAAGDADWDTGAAALAASEEGSEPGA